MRKKNYKGAKVSKRVVAKCEGVCRTYDAIQYQSRWKPYGEGMCEQKASYKTNDNKAFGCKQKLLEVPWCK